MKEIKARQLLGGCTQRATSFYHNGTRYSGIRVASVARGEAATLEISRVVGEVGNVRPFAVTIDPEETLEVQDS